MTELEQKSIKAQLELALEVIEAQNSFFAHLKSSAATVIGTEYADEKSRIERWWKFLNDLKEYSGSDNMSTLCMRYYNEAEMKKKILNKFR